MLLIAWSGAVAAWQFDARRLSAADLRHPALPVPVRAVSQVFRVLPVPRAAWESAVFLLVNNAGSSPVYLLGKRYDRGHWAYFLVGAAVKSPAACQALVLAGLAALLSRYRRRLVLSDVFWIAPGPLYFILASMSSLQFGFRLVLPALPFALLPAGTALVSWPALTRFPALIGVLLAAPSASIYPHGISYFNFWAGGPEKGLKYLADSNLDWGQDLPRVAEIASAHRIPRIRLCYFGSASPFRVLREGEVEVIPPPWSPDLARGTELRPEPGWYAISATLLPGYFFDAPYVDYYRAFRDRRPVARAGYSIYIYKVE